MSDWIERKGEEIQRTQAERDRIADFIARSDYWLKLRQQIGADVETLNKNSIWTNQLIDTPIKIVDSSGSFEIKHAILPSVYVTVTNKYDYIELQIRGRKDKDSPSRSHPTEHWNVASDGVEMFLQRDGTLLLVPEQASQYILTFVTDVLEAMPSAPLQR